MKLDIDTPGDDVRIEIIPLMDVVFCILTFFILAAVGLTRQQAIGVDLPTAETSTPVEQAPLLIGVDQFGQIYLEKTPISPNQLSQALLEYQQVAPGSPVGLYAAKDTRYDDVMQVLDQIRLIVGDRVSLVTLPPLANPQSEADVDDPTLDPGLDPGLPSEDEFDTAPLTPDPSSPFDSGEQPLPGNQAPDLDFFTPGGTDGEAGPADTDG